MALDVGLTSGAYTLWQQQALFDFIIEVENQEIPVHKAIMASVSDYFRVMLSGPMLESSINRVKLQGHSAAAVSKLIELVYTGDANIVKENALEIIGPAVYLQMPLIIEASRKRLRNSLTVKNCLEYISVFVRYSFDEEKDKALKILVDKFNAAFQHYSSESTLIEGMEAIAVCWQRSEWELFGVVKQWVNLDFENRKKYIDSLMSLVRFGLMTPQQASAITRMDIYIESDSLWRVLVDKAIEYHSLPTHLKVLDESEQTKVRATPSPFVFSNDYVGGKNLFLSLDENNRWKKHVYPESGFTDYCFQDLIVVNNFLIALTNADGEQGEQWCIFDPRNLTWSKMANMRRRKNLFTIAHHGEHLYALGGRANFSSTDEVERYNFRNNTWTVIGNMPVAVAVCGACVYGNYLYCTGGADGEATNLVHRLNLDSLVWESKAPMLTPKSNHRMAVMNIGNEEVIITFEEKSLELEMYNPATNIWSKFVIPMACIHDLYAGDFERSMPVITGNTIYLIRLLGRCLKWTLRESGERPSEVFFKSVPVPASWEDADFQSVLLAVQHQVFR